MELYNKENLNIYTCLQEVPASAKRTIKGGRLKGFTDINPMWRIKALTEAFGPCGIGWKYEVTEKWTQYTEVTKETSVHVQVNIYVKNGEEWSEPIPGVGGSMLCENERSGPRHNDEAYKMALTDALSVACKALGVGANVYWAEGASKYERPAPAQSYRDKVVAECKARNIDMDELATKYNLTKTTTEGMYKTVYEAIIKNG